MQRYVTIQKEVGETPLQALERFRHAQSSRKKDGRAATDPWAKIPLAYAGRLDPMARGTLLILIGEECKRQKEYHALDKRYEFSVLFGVSSDTGDTLGRLTSAAVPPDIDESELTKVARGLKGSITLPYPRFSSKTVDGKPLHVWTLENRVHEIEIPKYAARIHSLQLINVTEKTGATITAEALMNIEKIPQVTEVSKALGSDFRRADVRMDWAAFLQAHKHERYRIATFACVSSSGLYMRTLAEVIAMRLGTIGLAYHIHRTHIGSYVPLGRFSFWRRRY